MTIQDIRDDLSQGITTQAIRAIEREDTLEADYVLAHLLDRMSIHEIDVQCRSLEVVDEVSHMVDGKEWSSDYSYPLESDRTRMTKLFQRTSSTVLLKVWESMPCNLPFPTFHGEPKHHNFASVLANTAMRCALGDNGSQNMVCNTLIGAIKGTLRCTL